MTKTYTIKELTVTEWANIIKQEVELLLRAKSRDCTNCRHLDADTQICRLAGKMPPPKIAVKGCEYHDEEIPF